MVLAVRRGLYGRKGPRPGLPQPHAPALQSLRQMGGRARDGAENSGHIHRILRPLHNRKRPPIRHQRGGQRRRTALRIRGLHPAFGAHHRPQGLHTPRPQAAGRPLVVETGRLLLSAVCRRIFNLYDSVHRKRGPGAPPAQQGHKERICLGLLRLFAWIYTLLGERHLGGENGHSDTGDMRQRGPGLLLPYAFRRRPFAELLPHRLRKGGGRHSQGRLRPGQGSRGRRTGAALLSELPEPRTADLHAGPRPQGDPERDVRPEPQSGEIQDLAGRLDKPRAHQRNGRRPLPQHQIRILDLRLPDRPARMLSIRRRPQGHHLCAYTPIQHLPACRHTQNPARHSPGGDEMLRGDRIRRRPRRQKRPSESLQRAADQAYIQQQQRYGHRLVQTQLRRPSGQRRQRSRHRLVPGAQRLRLYQILRLQRPENPRDSPAAYGTQQPYARRRPQLRTARLRPLGLQYRHTRRPGAVGRHIRNEGARRMRPAELPRRAEPGHAFLPEYDLLQRRIYKYKPLLRRRPLRRSRTRRDACRI